MKSIYNRFNNLSFSIKIYTTINTEYHNTGNTWTFTNRNMCEIIKNKHWNYNATKELLQN